MFEADLAWELGATIGIVVLWALSLFAIRSSFARDEWKLITLSCVAHFLSCFAGISLAEASGGGDMVGYVAIGRFLAELMRRDFFRAFPEVLSLLFQDPDVAFANEFEGVGSETGSMKALCGFIMLLVGNSTYAGAMVMTVASFYGKLALYRVFREVLAERLRTRLIVAAMLVPSCVFWSCGMIKETVAMSGLGWLVLGMHRIAQGRAFRGVVIVIAPLLIVGLIKPYVLFPLIIAGGLYAHAHRGGTRIRPVYFVIAGIVIAVGLVLLGELFPRYALDSVGDQTSIQGDLISQTDANTNFTLAGGSRSSSGQLALAPLGLFAALFRPLPFEARNLSSFICSLETTAFLIYAIRGLRRHGVIAAWRLVRSTPILTFAAVYTALFGTAVGLATPNFGSLSRYRIPLIPFLALLVFLLNAVAEPVTDEEASTPAERRRADFVHQPILVRLSGVWRHARPKERRARSLGRFFGPGSFRGK